MTYPSWTTDSVLHALHRSYDAILGQLEVSTFTQTVADTLQKSHDVLARTADSLRTPKLKDSAADVDVYTHAASDRLTDEQWRTAIQNDALPARPSWFTAAFPGNAIKRTLDGEEEATRRESELREREIQRIMRDISVVHDPAERQRLMDEIRKLRASPLPKVRPGT